MTLHTKYRPEEWEDVVGQDAAVASIQGAIDNETSQPFVFAGPSGTGKTTLARILASYVGCEPANLIEMNASDATSIEDMRSLIERLQFKPRGNGVRVVIIDEAHGLSGKAWEALLKPTEEPPEGTYWVFCTTLPHKVPATMKTRCATVALQDVGHKEITELLAWICEQEGIEESSIDDEALEIIAKYSLGSPRRAITMLGKVAYAGLELDELRKELGSLSQEQEGEAIELARLLMKDKPSFSAIVDVLKRLKGTDPEGVRRVICAYMTTVCLGAKRMEQWATPVSVLQAFHDPYPNGERSLYPILVSLMHHYGDE